MKNFRISEETYLKHYRLLIDGRRVVRIAYPHQYIVCGDDKVPVISAASIVAKVYRDRHMERMRRKFFGYGFEKHVGYGTKDHREQLERLGVCAIHRKTYAPIKLCTGRNSRNVLLLD